MRRSAWPVLFMLGVVGLGAPSAGLLGQQGAVPGGPAPTLPADTIELVFEREVFTYPGFERRNPFRPLTGVDAVGPRFEDLVLMGRILSSNAAASIALIGARTAGAQASQAPARTYRLRVGDVIGNTRVLEIREQVVLVEVEEFGLRETRVLELRRPTEPMETGQAEAAPAPEPAPAPQTSPDPTTDDPAPDAASDLTQNGNGGRS